MHWNNLKCRQRPRESLALGQHHLETRILTRICNCNIQFSTQCDLPLRVHYTYTYDLHQGLQVVYVKGDVRAGGRGVVSP